MALPRPRELLTLAALLVATGLMLRVGLDPLISGDGVTGKAATAGSGMLALGGLLVFAALMMVEPAWPLSLGVAAMIFSSNWDLVGSPIALDRVLVAGGVISLV